MSRFKHAIDSPHAKGWPERVGNLIVNFSAIEMEASIWLIHCSEQFDNFYKFAAMPFAERVKELKRYVDARSANKRWRKEAMRAWNEALELAKLRNRVAHNPIIFGWSDPAETGAPDFVGIPLMRGKRTPMEIFLSAKTIVDGATSAVHIAKRLGALRVEWCKLRDAGKIPPVPTNLRGRPWYVARLRFAVYCLKIKLKGI
jgi:hypothetical protein